MKSKAREVVAALLCLGGGAAVAAASGCGAVGSNDCAEGVDCEIINEYGTSNGSCWGACVDVKLRGFGGPPLLVWMGATSAAPSSCSEAVPDGPRREIADVKFYGSYFADPDTDNECPACACTPPACVLPVGLTATSLFMCQEGPGETVTPFGAPPGWNGACVSPGAVPPEVFGSFAIAPVTERPCAAVPQEEEKPRRGIEAPPSARRIAFACKSQSPDGLCPNKSDLCMMGQDKLTPGWRRCTASTTDDETVTCDSPAGPGEPPTYSEKYTFWTGVDDSRGCTACTCTPTTQSTCEALLSTFEDAACTMPIDSAVVRNNGICHDAEPGTALGSLSARWLVNEPGSCAPAGGTPEGSVTLVGKRTICCEPERR